MKQAYYRWIAAQQAVTVLDATLAATRENLRANDSLYRNGKVTRDLVYRAEADVLEIEQERLAAASRVRIAQSYVNLLRNAPLAQPLPAAALDAATIDRFRARLLAALAGRQLEAQRLQEIAADRRQELKSLDAAIAAGEAQQDLARAAFKPALAFGAEAGIQGEDYGFDGRRPLRARFAGAALQRLSRRRGPGGAARGARAHRRAAGDARTRRPARAARGAAGGRELRRRRSLARHRRQARRGGGGRLHHHQPQARPGPDQPGRIHRRATGRDRRRS